MLLTPEATTRAKADGFDVKLCVDADTGKNFFMVVRVDGRFPSDAAAGAYVVERAKAGSKFHCDVLSTLMASHVAAAQQTKRRKR